MWLQKGKPWVKLNSSYEFRIKIQSNQIRHVSGSIGSFTHWSNYHEGEIYKCSPNKKSTIMGNYQVLGSVFLTNFYPIHLHHHHRKDLHSSPILSSHFRIHHYLVPNLSCLRSCHQNHFSQCSIKLTQFNVNLFVMNFKTSSLTSLH